MVCGKIHAEITPCASSANEAYWILYSQQGKSAFSKAQKETMRDWSGCMNKLTNVDVFQSLAHVDQID